MFYLRRIKGKALKDILLITPPFTQINTPYPATLYLKGFLNTKGISSFQCDLGIEVILQIFSEVGLQQVFTEAKPNIEGASENAQRIFALQNRYMEVVEPAIAFLQGKAPTLARKIVAGNFLPEASRFSQMEDHDFAFGTMGLQDQAKYMTTMFIEDLSDFMIECVDEHFGFSRYAERLGMSAARFDELNNQLQQDLSYIDNITLAILETQIQQHQPKMVGFAVPFPGNLYSAFRCAQYIKKQHPHIKTLMGGGFPNTELRSLKDERVMTYFDFISLDDGELPVELIVQAVLHPTSEPLQLKRTYHLENGALVYNDRSTQRDYAMHAVGTPDYSDLLLDRYISVIEVANPMHSLWSDGRWNKLTMAHGCYWGRCTFCDTSLDYIGRYEPLAASLLVDRMESIMQQTGESGFHFVDEAAPPAMMRAVAIEIIRRKLNVTWWTNVRFEKSFTLDLCKLLAASGCVAVSGGLEVASKRLLSLINKGLTLPQVAKVCANLTEARIMVHSYLMYGFPTQTEQETVDSLEVVRQLFELGIVQSGFWHRFALTAHSPVGLITDAFEIIPHKDEIYFAYN